MMRLAVICAAAAGCAVPPTPIPTLPPTTGSVTHTFDITVRERGAVVQAPRLATRDGQRIEMRADVWALALDPRALGDDVVVEVATKCRGAVRSEQVTLAHGGHHVAQICGGREVDVHYVASR